MGMVRWYVGWDEGGIVGRWSSCGDVGDGESKRL